MIHIRYRRRVAAALAFFVVGLLAVPAVAAAAPSEKAQGGEAGKSGESTHHEAAAEEDAPVVEATATSSEAQAASAPNHVCDGDSGGHSDTGNGANTDGSGNEYHNTCPAGPSQNGNGGGDATGRPCMGCVGQADDKNPPGQANNGGDANSGYECDVKGNPNGGNNGIGKGNPAHTGCVPQQPPPPDNPPPGNPPPGNPPPGNPPGQVLSSVSVTAGTPAAEVLGVVINRAPADVAAAPLARTGAPIEALFQGGVLAVLLGAFLLALSGVSWRRRVVEVPFEL